MNDDFHYWSLRSEQAMINAINAGSGNAHGAHWTMVLICVNKAVAAMRGGDGRPAGRL